MTGTVDRIVFSGDFLRPSVAALRPTQHENIRWLAQLLETPLRMATGLPCETVHWDNNWLNGSRLDRDQTGRFGSAPYAREELVAELASAFLCAALGIEPTVRHADYLGSWLEVLRADNRAIFRAASQASKAAEFLLQCESAPQEQAA